MADYLYCPAAVNISLRFFTSTEASKSPKDGFDGVSEVVEVGAQERRLCSLVRSFMQGNCRFFRFFMVYLFLDSDNSLVGTILVLEHCWP